MADASKIWQEKFAARFAAERDSEEERRKVAFIEMSFTVCGEEVRCMTARDMLILDGIKNPFVAGGTISPGHIPQFLWLLSVRNNPAMPIRTAYQRGKLMGRARKMDYAQAIKEISDFVEMMFLDSPTSGKSEHSEQRGVQTCFLAPLLMRLACEMGALDPASGFPLIESPLPRLFQYLKTLRAKAEGKDFQDSSPSDRLIDEWLIEWNAQMGAEQLDANK